MAHDWMRAAMEEDDAAPSTDRRFIIRRHSNREPPGLPIFKQRRNNVARLRSAFAITELADAGLEYFSQAQRADV